MQIVIRLIATDVAQGSSEPFKWERPNRETFGFGKRGC